MSDHVFALAVAVFLFFAGFGMGSIEGRAQMRHEAIKRGHGRYAMVSGGEFTFEWIDAKEQGK